MPSRYFYSPVRGGGGGILDGLAGGIAQGADNFSRERTRGRAEQRQTEMDEFSRSRVEDADALADYETTLKYGGSIDRQDYGVGEMPETRASTALMGGAPAPPQQGPETVRIGNMVLPSPGAYRKKTDAQRSGAVDAWLRGQGMDVDPEDALAMHDQGLDLQALKPWEMTAAGRGATHDTEIAETEHGYRMTELAERGRLDSDLDEDNSVRRMNELFARAGIDENQLEQRLRAADWPQMYEDSYGDVDPLDPEGLQMHLPEGQTPQSLRELFLGGGELPVHPEEPGGGGDSFDFSGLEPREQKTYAREWRDHMKSEKVKPRDQAMWLRDMGLNDAEIAIVLNRKR